MRQSSRALASAPVWHDASAVLTGPCCRPPAAGIGARISVARAAEAPAQKKDDRDHDHRNNDAADAAARGEPHAPAAARRTAAGHLETAREGASAAASGAAGAALIVYLPRIKWCVVLEGHPDDGTRKGAAVTQST